MTLGAIYIAMIAFIVLSGLLYAVALDQHRERTNYDTTKAWTLHQRREVLSKAIFIAFGIVAIGVWLHLA